jgi:hypothetical protein
MKTVILAGGLAEPWRVTLATRVRARLGRPPAARSPEIRIFP